MAAPAATPAAMAKLSRRRSCGVASSSSCGTAAQVTVGLARACDTERRRTVSDGPKEASSPPPQGRRTEAVGRPTGRAREAAVGISSAVGEVHPSGTHATVARRMSSGREASLGVAWLRPAACTRVVVSCSSAAARAQVSAAQPGAARSCTRPHARHASRRRPRQRGRRCRGRRHRCLRRGCRSRRGDDAWSIVARRRPPPSIISSSGVVAAARIDSAAREGRPRESSRDGVLSIERRADGPARVRMRLRPRAALPRAPPTRPRRPPRIAPYPRSPRILRSCSGMRARRGRRGQLRRAPGGIRPMGDLQTSLERKFRTPIGRKRRPRPRLGFGAQTPAGPPLQKIFGSGTRAPKKGG
eukprot:scaffold31_cov312-Prasinococcus_capsulatus_cf.AAC.1